MWIEMGIFVLVILFALHQIRDVKREQRKRLDEKKRRESTECRVIVKNMFGNLSRIRLSLRRITYQGGFVVNKNAPRSNPVWSLCT